MSLSSETEIPPSSTHSSIVDIARDFVGGNGWGDHVGWGGDDDWGGDSVSSRHTNE